MILKEFEGINISVKADLPMKEVHMEIEGDLGTIWRKIPEMNNMEADAWLSFEYAGKPYDLNIFIEDKERSACIYRVDDQGNTLTKEWHTVEKLSII